MRLVEVVCPECKGDYWADTLRKCSNCMFGYVMVEVEEDAPERKRAELAKEHPHLRSLRDNQIDDEAA